MHFILVKFEACKHLGVFSFEQQVRAPAFSFLSIPVLLTSCFDTTMLLQKMLFREFHMMLHCLGFKGLNKGI